MTTAFQRSAFQDNAYQIDALVGNTPGFTTHLPGRKRHESDEEKLARRVREGTVQLPPKPLTVDSGPNYAREAKRLAAAIATARADAEASRQAIARLEERARLRQTEQARSELLRAEQALQLAVVQEAVFLEELEVLDVAFFAAAALRVTLQ